MSRKNVGVDKRDGAELNSDEPDTDSAGCGGGASEANLVSTGRFSFVSHRFCLEGGPGAMAGLVNGPGAVAGSCWPVGCPEAVAGPYRLVDGPGAVAGLVDGPGAVAGSC